MNKIIYVIVLSLALSACGMAEDFQNMSENQEKLQSLIKKENGWETQVGWNIHNGVLTQITIVVNANEVGEESVASVEKIVKDAVARTFDQKPQFLFIQIASSYGGET